MIFINEIISLFERYLFLSVTYITGAMDIISRTQIFLKKRKHTVYFQINNGKERAIFDVHMCISASEPEFWPHPFNFLKERIAAELAH